MKAPKKAKKALKKVAKKVNKKITKKTSVKTVKKTVKPVLKTIAKPTAKHIKKTTPGKTKNVKSRIIPPPPHIPVSKNVSLPPVFKGKKKKHYDKLMQIRNQITELINFHSEEALSPNASSELAGSMSNHMADYGSDNFLHEMELEMMSDEGEVVEMIDEAIERLISNEYGKCLQCGDRIPEARLNARPQARYCLKCKAALEENGARDM